MHRQLLRRLRSLWIGALLLSLAGCAAYHVGTQSLYPTHIRTVYVPMFESNSFRRNLGEELTEAVMKEIELKTPYKVVSSADADSTLSGIITTESKRVTNITGFGDPRQVQVNLVVKVSWVDRTGNAMYNGVAVPLDDAATWVSGSSSFVPEFGQSTATAHRQAIQRVAAQIVGLMEAPW